MNWRKALNTHISLTRTLFPSLMQVAASRGCFHEIWYCSGFVTCSSSLAKSCCSPCQTSGLSAVIVGCPRGGYLSFPCLWGWRGATGKKIFRIIAWYRPVGAVPLLSAWGEGGEGCMFRQTKEKLVSDRKLADKGGDSNLSHTLIYMQATGFLQRWGCSNILICTLWLYSLNQVVFFQNM